MTICRISPSCVAWDLAVAVGDATPEVKRVAHHVTKAIGGKGAAREVVELILKSKGIWEEMIDKARA